MAGINNSRERAEKVMQRIEELSLCSAAEGQLTRLYGTKAFLDARDKLLRWMLADGLTVCTDRIGNVRGRAAGAGNAGKTFVLGSHFDTVVNAGKYDGTLGILVAMELVAHLIQSRMVLPFSIEVIGFCEEEGVRFKAPYLGSRSVAGSFDESLFERMDEQGITLKEVVAAIGGDVSKLAEDRIAKDNWLGYLEVHIEQGPVLCERDVPVALVSSIAGQRRVEISFTGVAGHAGTVPMPMRRDALAGAAEFITAVENYALAQKGAIVATTGTIRVHDGATNVIAGKVTCSLDLRSGDGQLLSMAYAQIQQLAETICHKRNIRLDWKLLQQTDPLLCDEQLTETLSNAIATCGFEVIKLVSGAGHDAVPVAAVSPVAMLFVRCFEGISHNPLENVTLNDIQHAIEVGDVFLVNLIQQYTVTPP